MAEYTPTDKRSTNDSESSPTTTTATEAVVTLLVDNSGSMRGAPIATAAMCTDLLARTLERCGVKVSTLHFYEEKGLIHSTRNAGNQRRYKAEVLRRVSE